jgi:hypothetical protein
MQELADGPDPAPIYFREPTSDDGVDPFDSANGEFKLSGGDHVALTPGTYYFSKFTARPRVDLIVRAWVIRDRATRPAPAERRQAVCDNDQSPSDPGAIPEWKLPFLVGHDNRDGHGE